MAEVIDNKNERMEQMEKTEQTMSVEECNRLIDEYTKCIDEAMKAGNMDMVDYYKEKREPIKEARNQKWKEHWENRREEIAQEAEELQKKIELGNIERRTPTYGLPTTEEGWRKKAEVEFRKSGESAYYKECMNEAAKYHVKEALDGK